MAKKKRVVRKKKFSIKEENSNNVKHVISSRFKIGMVFRNLILFVLLTILSYLLYFASSNGVLMNLFYFLRFIFGFISVAFFIALLVLLFMKWMKK
jgi:hypothetical protein